MNHSKKLFAITIFLLATSQYTYSSGIKKINDYIEKQCQLVEQIEENIFNAILKLDNPEKILDEMIENRIKDWGIKKTCLHQVGDKTVAIEDFNYDRDWEYALKALNEIQCEKNHIYILQEILKNPDESKDESITKVAKENKKVVGCISYTREKNKEKTFFKEFLILYKDPVIKKMLRNHMNSCEKQFVENTSTNCKYLY